MGRHPHSSTSASVCSAVQVDLVVVLNSSNIHDGRSAARLGPVDLIVIPPGDLQGVFVVVFVVAPPGRRQAAGLYKEDSRTSVKRVVTSMIGNFLVIKMVVIVREMVY